MNARKWAQRALELAPYDEEGFRRYVELLARMRDLSTALRAYERFSRRLAQELQTAPAPETAALVERLRREPATVLVSKDVSKEPRAESVRHGSLSSGDARATADSVRPLTAFRARAVTGAAVLIAAIAALAHLSAQQGTPPASSKLRSILVLPLENLAADPTREFFSDGLTEALISELGQIRSLTVFSRTTSMRLRDNPSPLSEIAGRLGADGIIEGSAQQVGGRVRVDLRLIDGVTEQLLWADTYEEDLRDVLDLQKRIARAVAHEVGVAISVEESDLLSGGAPVQPAAYEEYLRGRYWFSKWTSDGFREATRSFQHAVGIDSTFAAAYAGLAYALLHVCYFGLPDAPAASVCHQRVESAALRALELDDHLAEAYLTLGFVRWWGHPRDRKASEEALLTALRLNPGHAEIHSRYAFLMSTLGRHEEAVAAFERAYQLDPLAPDRAGFVAWELGVAGRFDEAERAARSAIALEPEFANSHAWLGMTILAPQGRYEEAVASLRRALDLAGGHTMFRGMLGHVLGAAGRTAEAEAILEELLHGPGSDRVPPYYVALVYMGLGRRELALSWLEKANREGWGHVIYLNVYHGWAPLRGHPRFEQLLEDIGLPPTSMAGANGAEHGAA